jgi:hypothetical protein
LFFIRFSFSISLYVDRRSQNRLYYHLPEESEPYDIIIAKAPLFSDHEFENFSGSMKKFVYYRSTKYEDVVWGDGMENSL